MSDTWDASESGRAGPDRAPPRRGRWAGLPIRGVPAYALAAAGLVVATLARVALDSLLGDAAPYVTYFATALALFLVAGTGPALLEAIGGGAAGVYLFVEPRGALEATRSGAAGLVLYLLLVAATLWVLRSLRDARATAERRQAELLAAEAAMSAQRETLRATLASIADAVVATDRDGRATFLNGVAERLLGRRAAEAIGRPLAEAVPLAGPGGDLLDCTLRRGEVFAPGDALELAGPGRATTPVEVVASPIRGGGEGEGEGEALGVVVVLRDVSSARRAAAELGEAKEAAEAANRAKDRFLAALGHELRTPLTPALLGVSFLLEGREAPDSCRPIFEMIRRNIEAEARLIDDLLDIVEMQRDRLVGTPRLVDAHALIREALDACRPVLDDAGVAPSTKLEAMPRHIHADPDRFRQAIANLLRNAARFTPGGGRVIVRARHEPGDAGAPGRLVVEVSDTGAGLAPEALATLFRPFDLARRDPNAPIGGGLGLGLAIARAIVVGAGGTIEAMSPGLGLGASFTLALDAQPDPAPTPAPPLDGAPPRGPLHILVVEDDEATRRALTQALGALGHGVTTADTVASASALVDGDVPFDLLISDIGLPDGTGHDVLRRIRSTRPIPAIALSGFGLDDDLRRSRAAGFAEHLVKPVDLPTLDAAIRRAVGAEADRSAVEAS